MPQPLLNAIIGKMEDKFIGEDHCQKCSTGDTLMNWPVQLGNNLHLAALFILFGDVYWAEDTVDV